MLLELKGLSKAFGSVVVADGIDLAVEEGTALGIIGPNGAGKSSLFNLISGNLSPDAGKILLDGQNISAMPPPDRCVAGIGRSYQIPQPFETLTVFENLLVGAVYGNSLTEAQAADRCGQVLEQTGLLDRANRVSGSLSLLERKRLEMARALATEPRILLLDEIAGGLTEHECADLVETIQDIHAQGITIIWIEHIVHALLKAVEHLIVLNFGQLIANGDPRTVVASKGVQEIYMGIEE
ncbi:MAG: ABC transporter ATP-binding protein [Rhodospirillaceae bacterium TMED167]|nr:ABC transporter ATP-binding protein [Rhodospirillaceae bacterium]MDG2033436.1 ABC transporter ATP-binding protein [Rhodospirillales bacterium]OUW30520.1 MAG: ABC transporter ATP-binding protein [Rhodospirillaceae bacterium TMED167]